jgi:guanine deaminase
MSEKDFMARAIAKTREGIAFGNSPFGAVVVKDGVVVACAHNTVWPDTDPTAHAEVNAIRQAARALATIDLSGCVMYTTCEPCPMCLSAIHWARFDRVVYGATIADAQGSGFNELTVDAKKLAELGGSKLVVDKIASEESARECARLFQEWKQTAKGGVY